MSAEKRRYRMGRREESQEQTRLRITESAMALHGTLGPSRTSISAIAAHAGVRRSTLYRHFADEAAVFDACTAHWRAANPLPDLGGWSAIESPDERLGAALRELFAYYRQTEGMLDNLFRDELVVPMVEERFAGFHGYLEAARDTLMAGRMLRGAARRRTHAAIGHAMAFSTWKSLVREQRLGDAEAAILMQALVASPTLPRR